MHSFVKNVFIIIGTMFLSLILFMAVFGDTTKQFIWSALEPAFQANWNWYTFNDGTLIDAELTEDFNNLKEVPN